MEEIKPKTPESLPLDVTNEFLNLDIFEFSSFLRTVRKEPSLSIKVDWKDANTGRRLKAFVEDMNALGKQKRIVTIRATEEQKKEEPNVFASGIKWEKV